MRRAFLKTKAIAPKSALYRRRRLREPFPFSRRAGETGYGTKAGKVVTDGEVEEARDAHREKCEGADPPIMTSAPALTADKHPVLEGIPPVPLLEKDLTCAEKSYASLRPSRSMRPIMTASAFSLGEEEEDRDLRQRLIDFKDHPEDIGLSALLSSTEDIF